jgi:hypothetical protein
MQRVIEPCNVLQRMQRVIETWNVLQRLQRVIAKLCGIVG